MRLILNE